MKIKRANLVQYAFIRERPRKKNTIPLAKWPVCMQMHIFVRMCIMHRLSMIINSSPCFFIPLMKLLKFPLLTHLPPPRTHHNRFLFSFPRTPVRLQSFASEHKCRVARQQGLLKVGRKSGDFLSFKGHQTPPPFPRPLCYALFAIF